MPMYNELCEACSSEEDVLLPSDTFKEEAGKKHTCKKCGKDTAYYSLGRLPINQKADLDSKQPMVVRDKSTQLQWLEGFSKRG